MKIVCTVIIIWRVARLQQNTYTYSNKKCRKKWRHWQAWWKTKESQTGPYSTLKKWQNASGKFEGDIVLNDEQLRNRLINTVRRWPNKVVPFVIDEFFSEYCSTKLQSGVWGMEGNVMHYEYRLSSGKDWRLNGRSNGDSYLSLPLKTITHSHNRTIKSQASNVNIPTILRTLLHQICGYY